MFHFIDEFFCRQKSKKMIAEIQSLEEKFTILEIITFDHSKIAKNYRNLIKNKKYEDIVSRYNVCLQQIDNHNSKVKALIFAYNSILQKYPIRYILDNIETFDKSRLDELLHTINEVSEFTIPPDFERKIEYSKYKLELYDIYSNYDNILRQKNLIKNIHQEIQAIPDCYIDDEKELLIIEHIRNLSSELSVFKKIFFPLPQLDKVIFEKHNEDFINRHLNDPIFDNVNGKSLDIDQRRAVLCDAKSNLTIAGAGSGKTLTICGKIKYLLEKSIADESEILLLSYSKTSSLDLAEKVSLISKNLTVETFHALGLKILTTANGRKKAIEEQLKSYISQFFDEELSNNPRISNELFEYLSLYFYAPPAISEKYKNEGDIFNELKKQDFRTLKDRLKSLSPDKEKLETLKNEFVKSQEELAIANYLFINGINYEYERPYEIDTTTVDKRQYLPDFYLSDYGIYLEHYGIDRFGKAPQYEKKAGDEYVASMQWKRKTHQENNTVCIETYSYEFREGILFNNLKKKLLEQGVQFSPLSQKEVSNALHSVYAGRDFSSFLNLIATFISLYKSQIKDASGFEDLKNQLLGQDYDAHRTRLFLDICKEIYNYYIENLRASNKIDFDDMILQSIDLLDSTPGFQYKYIIVDEFQDISKSRTRFLQKLISHGNSKLFAVGDDWQAIYRFAGCDINVFLEFDKIFPNAKLNYITSTHRNSAELQEIVEPFITANPFQYKKHIKSNIHQDKPVRIIFHIGNKSMALTNALADIASINPTASILVLGRNKRDIDSCICKQIQVYNYKTIKHLDYPNLHLKYSTVHGSKGLECDFVIVINGEDAQNGFPNKTEDDNILNLLLGKKNKFEYAEERRLFYVALTRTKSIVYLLADKRKPSKFIREIKAKCHVLRDDSSEDDENNYLCPWCKSGHLIVRTSEVNKKTFYGCSNYPYCTYTNDDMKAVYNNQRCTECGDFMVQRQGKYGSFWGCHNYPRCRHTKQIQEQTSFGFTTNR